MMEYVSILRGINVGGNKKVKMTELKSLYEVNGFQNIRMYIQSGNVAFSSHSENKMEIKNKIENFISSNYDFEVPVMVRTKEEIDFIYDNSPFVESLDEQNDTKILISFLSNTPKEKDIKNLMTYVKEPESLVVMNDFVYLHAPNGYGKSKLSNNFLESKLKVLATTRNYKTLKALREL